MIKRPTFYIVSAMALLVLGYFGLGSSERRQAASFAGRFSQMLEARATDGLRQLVVSPSFLADKAPAERDHLMIDLLAGEVSAEGMNILVKEGVFGPLSSVFPTEQARWCKAFDVRSEDCVAFKLVRDNLTAELVLHRESDGSYRVLRANDIRQLAASPPVP